MNILVLGAGLQGKAVLKDLDGSPDVRRIVAADADPAGLQETAAWLASDKLETVLLDAADEHHMAAHMAGVDVVIDMLPTPFHDPAAETAVRQKVHYVNASYATPAMKALDAQAKAAGVALLPEFGLDPGIDLVLAGRLLQDLDEIHEFYSYGAGIPEPSAADNPIRYKISWTFDGVLKSYRRDAELWQAFRPVPVSGRDIFNEEHMHPIEVPGLGTLEAYPNGRVSGFLEMMNITGTVRRAGRYSARWPGHTDFWRKLSALGFLEETPVTVDGIPVKPRHFVRDLLAPQLQYREDERDVAFIRLDARGLKNERPCHVIYDVIDYRDLDSGLLAMQRTVGYTASIGAQMLAAGEIAASGLLSPITDVPTEPVLTKLAQRGIEVQTRIEWD